MKSPSKYGKKLTTIYYNNNIFISFFHLFSTPNLLQGWREPLPLGDTGADLRGQWISPENQLQFQQKILYDHHRIYMFYKCHLDFLLSRVFSLLLVTILCFAHSFSSDNCKVDICFEGTRWLLEHPPKTYDPIICHRRIWGRQRSSLFRCAAQPALWPHLGVMRWFLEIQLLILVASEVPKTLSLPNYAHRKFYGIRSFSISTLGCAMVSRRYPFSMPGATKVHQYPELGTGSACQLANLGTMADMIYMILIGTSMHGNISQNYSDTKRNSKILIY